MSTFGKMHVRDAGERVIVLLTAGNLALSQAVVNLLKEGIEQGAPETLLTVPSMFRAAQLVGRHSCLPYRRSVLRSRTYRSTSRSRLAASSGAAACASFVYPAGISSRRHRYVLPADWRHKRQAGPRPRREYDPRSMTVKLVLVSMDSTLRSNLTVGLPIDLCLSARRASRSSCAGGSLEDTSISHDLRAGRRAARHMAIPRPDWTG
jgi:putative proteasome-type protease